MIDIPKDVQFKRGPYVGPSNIKHKTYRPRVKGDLKKIEQAVEMIAAAKRPVFYTGGGIINSGPLASQLLREFVRMTGYPITSTLMGLGAYPASDKQWLGMLGMHGTYEANLAMHGCDLMIALGSRFDDRVTGRLDQFSPDSKKIHVDIDPSSINKTVRVDVGHRRRCGLRARRYDPALEGEAVETRSRGAQRVERCRSTVGGRAIASPTNSRKT